MIKSHQGLFLLMELVGSHSCGFYLVHIHFWILLTIEQLIFCAPGPSHWYIWIKVICNDRYCDEGSISIHLNFHVIAPINDSPFPSVLHSANDTLYHFQIDHFFCTKVFVEVDAISQCHLNRVFFCLCRTCRSTYRVYWRRVFRICITENG